MQIDINAEVGESFGVWPGGDDAGVIPHLTTASVACGFHAGDYNSMLRTAELASQHGVEVGAHCSYLDILGFGYRAFAMTAQELKGLILYQLGALDAMVRATGGRLHHVKPHGALYMKALVDPDVAAAVVDAVITYDPGLVLYTSADSECEKRSIAAGLKTVIELFADRPLRADGTLLVDWQPHFEPTPANVAERVRQFLTEGRIPAVEGGFVEVRADCICIHADSGEVAAAVRRAVAEVGATPAAPDRGP